MPSVVRLVLGAALAVTITASGHAAWAAQTDCFALTATGISTMPGTETTSSQSYVPLVSYTMNTFGTECVHIQFNAQFRTKTPKAVRLRVTLNGNPSGFPGFITLTTSGGGYDERAATFFMPALASGVQEIGVEFASDDGTPVSARNGLLRVQHNNDR